MHRFRIGTLAVLVALAACASAPAAPDLTGTWLAADLTPEILSGQPQNVRVLIIRKTNAGLVGKLLIPSLMGMPIAVEQQGERVQLAIRMARGMETPIEATFAGDRLSIAAGDPSKPPVALRRASPDELQVLERLAPKKLPLPPMSPLPSNGLARTPPMGFSTWNYFQTKIDDRTMREIADAMVSTGLRDAGYVHVNIDDGWQGDRGTDGTLHPNRKFPDMKALADYLHERGLKLGIYTSPGPRSCAGFTGSYGHEEQDARTFAEWGVDYVKHDWCSAGLVYDDDEMPAVYRKMAAALRATGRPMVYSLCQYGRADVWKWGADAGGNLWRTTGDIADQWQIMSSIGFAQDELAPFTKPGHWNDPDMLEVGNGHMTAGEYRTHMSLWALLAAPLIAGHDVRSSSPETLAILTNREVIAIDQDPLGRSGRRVVQRGPLEVWVRPLDGGRTAVGLFNRGNERATIDATLAELRLDGPVSARDVWAARALGAIEDRITADVEPHGVQLLLLEPSPRDPSTAPPAR